MDLVRYNALNEHFHDPDPQWELTREEIEDGWHWCYDWDFLFFARVCLKGGMIQSVSYNKRAQLAPGTHSQS